MTKDILLSKTQISMTCSIRYAAVSMHCRYSDMSYIMTRIVACRIDIMASGAGFEPTSTGSEPIVLPLNYPEMSEYGFRSWIRTNIS